MHYECIMMLTNTRGVTLNPSTQILPILLMGGGSKGNNGIVTSHATTTDLARQGISTSTRAQASCLHYGCFTLPST
jgi:hypothetical protein